MGETPDSPTLERRSSADRGLQTTTVRVSRWGIPRRGKAEFDTHPCPARLDTFMAPMTVRPAPPAHVQSVRDAADSETRPLQSYFRQLARTEVMSQAQEVALAERIASLRCELWHGVLGYPPFVAGVCELAREHLDSEHCPADLDDLVSAARALRDRELVAHRKHFAEVRLRFAAQLAAADLDAVVMDRVIADLQDIAGGKPGTVKMRVKLPPLNSVPFLAYVHSCKSRHHLLALARDEFIAANLRLVVAIARRYASRHMSLQDLVQEGNLGLMKAVDRFDVGKGYRFSTYGTWWIRHAVTRALNDKGRTVRVPVQLLATRTKILDAHRRAELLRGRPADEDELMTATGASRESLARIDLVVMEHPVSLDQKLGKGASIGLLELLEDREQTAAPELIEHAQHVEQLHEVLDVLTPLEVDILRRRVGLAGEEEMTLKEIGARHSLSRERIRQLQEQALEKLRGAFRERGLM